MMTLRRRIETWQDMAQHHALPYYGIAVAIAPVLLQKQLTVERVHILKTWLRAPTRNSIEIMYKRSPKFRGRRIEVRIDSGEPMYFGPRDASAIQKLLETL